MVKNQKIILKCKRKKLELIVGECNLIEKVMGLMFYRRKALLLFNFKKPRRYKIHSFFCDPFLAIYTDEKNKILEIIKVTSWKPLILPRKNFNKLIEIPMIEKYSKITNVLIAEIPLDNSKSHVGNRNI